MPETYSPAYLRLVLALLCLVYVVNFLDRQILSILLQSIKVELSLSDTQLGLLSGTTFGLFYATLGVPIARLADRYSRKWVMTICLILWSSFTALCGLATGFYSLAMFRVGVGVGEAGGSPPAHSMISDYFPPERRARALGIFALGVPIGILIGFLVGGRLNDTIGWRMTMVVVGLPGLLVAALVALLVKEPTRGHSEGLQSTAKPPSVGTVFALLLRSRAFRHVSFASALYAFVGYSVASWAAPFLIRSHAMTPTRAGLWLALALGVGGGIGNYLGGVFADRWGMRDERGRAWVPALSMLAAFPLGFVLYSTSSTALVVVLLAFVSALGLMYQPPAFAIVQSLATPAMRATASAFLLFVINIIGLACGPAVTGMISDYLEPTYGNESLRWALLIVSTLLAWASLHFYLAGRTLREDVAYVRELSAAEAARG